MLGSLGCAVVSLGSSGDSGFNGVRSGGRGVYLVAGFIGVRVGFIRTRALPAGPIVIVWFTRVRPGCLWVH